MAQDNTECIIGFYGNPGSGKSTICNSIIGEQKFQSGIKLGTGLTDKFQECKLPNGTILIDSPGLADPTRGQEAAEEIEKSLKKHRNYKIVFVVTIEAGRVKAQDIHTINSILSAVRSEVPIKYGLIINKVTKKVYEEMETHGEGLENCLILLKNKPMKTLIITKISTIEDEDNKSIEDLEIMGEIHKFLNELETQFINQEQVSLKITDFEERVRELEILVTLILDLQNKKIEDLQSQIESTYYRQILSSYIQSFKDTESQKKKGFCSTQ